MANYEATRYNFDGANLQDIEGVNTGIIVPWSDTSVPSGFLECDGAAVSRTTYANLFAVVGTTYGSGDGSTTFNLPDLQDYTTQSKSPTTNIGQQLGASSVPVTGNIGGSAASTALPVNLIGAHTHSGGAGTPFFTSPTLFPITRNGPGTTTGAAGGGGSHSHNLSANFTGGNMSTEQASLVLLYIIKT